MRRDDLERRAHTVDGKWRTRPFDAEMRIITLLMLASCGGEVADRYSSAQIGQPCTPAEEGETQFAGFDPQEVSVELPSPTADPGVIVCLANHFRGRVTCPYGQDDSGDALPSVDGATGGPFPSGVGPCVTAMGADVTGQVEPQCSDRRAAKAVTWSCRCANASGKTSDGATYCSCPNDTTCAQVVDPVAIGDQGPDLSGAYCIPTGANYEPFSACEIACDPTTTTCP
jgi:hypothetical protein